MKNKEKEQALLSKYVQVESMSIGDFGVGSKFCLIVEDSEEKTIPYLQAINCLARLPHFVTPSQKIECFSMFFSFLLPRFAIFNI